MNKIICVLSLLIILGLSSCSTAPKNNGDIYTLRESTEKGLESANKEAGRGNFINAANLLIEYKKQAILTDDPSLIIRVCLSYGNVLLSLKKTDEAYAEWNQAIAEAEKLGDIELLSVTRIFKARGDILSKPETAESVLAKVESEIKNVKTNALYIAYSWQTIGLAQLALKSFQKAEESIKRSLEIHEKEKSLENASYDWYTIASIRFLAGKMPEALQALEMAITIDRRIENSFGLAADWRAKGDVYSETGENGKAKEAYERARAIYEALGNKGEVVEIDKRMGK
ncbi:MAG: tetratricopeptide repeat protein [Treponema sp.]|jgi:tetratricopeptide (TPR) repeat protein|nr:tetratricopeptide repeat protein [Treponema sp.]